MVQEECPQTRHVGIYSFVPRLSPLVQMHCAEFNSRSIMHMGRVWE